MDREVVLFGLIIWIVLVMRVVLFSVVVGVGGLVIVDIAKMLGLFVKVEGKRFF